MILNPAIIALLIGSLLTSGYALYAAAIGYRIIRQWDIRSGHVQQLQLERRTYLVSTILNYLMGFELLSLFLFVYTADDIHGLFVGAMCAAGSLNVNAYGYPALVVKVVNFLLCGTWLIMNYTDNRGYDYPLIIPKYRFLLVISAMLLLETYLLIGYFKNIRPDVITSCCGTLFSTDAQSVAGNLASLPPFVTKVLLYSGVVLVLRIGIHVVVTGRGTRLFSCLSTGMMVFCIAAVIAVISVYYYQLPTHHCPFCLLQREYHYIGYPLYLALLTAGITGAGVGVIDRFRGIPSLQLVVPRLQKALSTWSMAGYIIFTAISIYPMIFSDFRLDGY